MVIICLIKGVSCSAEVNLIPIKYIFSETMKAVLVMICLIIEVSHSAEVYLLPIKYIFSETMKVVLMYLSDYRSLLFCLG